MNSTGIIARVDQKHDHNHDRETNAYSIEYHRVDLWHEVWPKQQRDQPGKYKCHRKPDRATHDGQHG